MDKSQAGIKTARRNINILRHADGTTLMAESEKELKNVRMKVKEKSEKAGLKLNIQKTKIMASAPSFHSKGKAKKMEEVIDFIFLGSKTTSDSDYSLETHRHLLLGRKAKTHPDSVLKSRDTTLPTKSIQSKLHFQ